MTKNFRDYMFDVVGAFGADRSIAQEFAQAVQGAAKKAGYDLTAAEILDGVSLVPHL